MALCFNFNEPVEKIEYKSTGTVTIPKYPGSTRRHGGRCISKIEELTSNIFCSASNEDVKWCMKVQYIMKTSPSYTISLCLVSAKHKSIFRAQSTLFALTGHEKICVDVMGPVTFDMDTNKQKNWPSTCSFTLNELFHSTSQLTLECEVIEIIDVNLNAKKITVTECDIIKHHNVLFTTKEWSDVTIIAKGQIEFEAHKLILAARSSIFTAMFKSAMTEQTTNRIEITDTEPKVIEEMLRFIYTGRVNGIHEIAIQLLAAADKYNLERLKLMCEAQLGDSLDVENAADILSIAEHHNCEKLKEVTISFIVNNIKAVMKTDGYLLMTETHIHLVKEILHSLVFEN